MLALNRAFEKGNLMVALSPVSWRPGLSLAATRLKTGETTTLDLYLSRHRTYTFIASADQETSDLDLYLRDSTGTVLFADQETDGTPILEFTVSRTGNYRLQFHLVESEGPTAWVGAALLQDEGIPLLKADFHREADRLQTAAASTIHSSRWASNPGQWPLQGFLLPPRTGQTMTGLHLLPGTSVIASSASPEIKNLVLYLANEQQEIVARSEARKAFAALSLRTDALQSYDLRIQSTDHLSPGFVLLAIFEK